MNINIQPDFLFFKRIWLQKVIVVYKIAGGEKHFANNYLKELKEKILTYFENEKI